MDRAFVLGSDELYPEWGYTALSRHREEVRFYVSATPDTLNRPASSLQGDQEAAREAVRMLATSRAQQLALDGVEPQLRRAIDPLAALGPRQIDPARERPPRPELELGRDSGADIGTRRRRADANASGMDGPPRLQDDAHLRRLRAARP